jgi:hypothetical protein
VKSLKEEEGKEFRQSEQKRKEGEGGVGGGGTQGTREEEKEEREGQREEEYPVLYSGAMPGKITSILSLCRLKNFSPVRVRSRLKKILVGGG